LADFGFAKEDAPNSLHTSIRNGYPQAPEYLTSKEYTPKSEIYSLGNILSDLLQFKFDRNQKRFPGPLRELVKDCTAHFSEERPEIDQVLDKNCLGYVAILIHNDVVLKMSSIAPCGYFW
jgi:serine/threonine protein kinase